MGFDEAQRHLASVSGRLNIRLPYPDGQQRVLARRWMITIANVAPESIAKSHLGDNNTTLTWTPYVDVHLLLVRLAWCTCENDQQKCIDGKN
jgi:hypothetical protein